MFFSTNNMSAYSATNTWITIQRGQNPGSDTSTNNTPWVTYGTNSVTWNTWTNMVGTNAQVGSLFANSILLSDIIDAGGLTWSGNAAGAAIYVSYGTNIPYSQYSLSGLSPNNPSDPSYNIQYQNFELTYTGGASGDQGDITAINFFGAAMSISSYASANATGPALQSVGYFASTENIYGQLKAITGGNPSVVLTNSTGQVTRVQGPSNYGIQPSGDDYGAYSSFNDYFASLATSSNTAVLSNNSAFNTTPNVTPTSNYTNADVTFVLTNSVSSTTNGYALSATGDIIVVNRVYTNGAFSESSTNVYSGITLNVTPTPLTGTNIQPNVASSYVYYGDQSPGADYIYMSGTNWDNLVNYLTTNNFVTANAGAAGAGVVQAQIFGELATGLAAGFIGSTNIVDQFPGIALGDLPSANWWSLTNIVAFSDVQSATNFFNTYADVIYQNSSNTVYGMVYSDRFLNISPYVSANSEVGSWMVDLYDPIAEAVPEPAAAALMVGGVMGFALYRTLRTKRRKLLGGKNK